MPHIILEYSKSLEANANIPAALLAMHDTLAAQGVDKARIKTRGVAVEKAVVGDLGQNGQMMHVTLLLLEGRNILTRQQYGQALYDVLKPYAPEECSVTLEVREMVKDTYIL